jgi:sulfide:quinone oxidoreductase
MEFGHEQVGMVDVFFQAGLTPRGDLVGPSTDLMANKVEFGSSRIARWFGREWSPITTSE